MPAHTPRSRSFASGCQPRISYPHHILQAERRVLSAPLPIRHTATSPPSSLALLVTSKEPFNLPFWTSRINECTCHVRIPFINDLHFFYEGDFRELLALAAASSPVFTFPAHVPAAGTSLICPPGFFKELARILHEESEDDKRGYEHGRYHLYEEVQEGEIKSSLSRTSKASTTDVAVCLIGKGEAPPSGLAAAVDKIYVVLVLRAVNHVYLIRTIFCKLRGELPHP